MQGFKSILSSRGDYDTTAAAAAVGTDLGLDSASFLFTVCLDHRLRVWNLNSGQIIGAMDLLNATRDPNEIGKWRLDPMQTNLIRIVGRIEGERTCVTYSPVGSGEFKFWSLKSDDGNSVDVNDMYPEVRLVPIPPLGSDVWTLADFFVVERQYNRGYQLWILWKNNIAYRIQDPRLGETDGDLFTQILPTHQLPSQALLIQLMPVKDGLSSSYPADSPSRLWKRR